MLDILKFIIFPSNKNTEKILNKSKKEKLFIIFISSFICIITFIIFWFIIDEYELHSYWFEKNINFGIFLSFMYLTGIFIYSIINKFSLKIIWTNISFKKSLYISIFLGLSALIITIIETIIEIILKINNIFWEKIGIIMSLWSFILLLRVIKFLTKDSLKTIFFVIIQAIITIIIWLILYFIFKPFLM